MIGEQVNKVTKNLKNSEISTESPLDSRKSKKVGSGAFSQIPRELEVDDLSNPAVGRMLLNERDQLQSQNAGLEKFKDAYYQADKKSAVLEEQVRGYKTKNNLTTLTTVIGGALLALASFSSGKLLVALIVCGLALIVGGISLNFKKDES